MSKINLEKSWLNILKSEFEKPYMKNLSIFLNKEKDKKLKIYPPGSKIFNALNLTPFDKVKVVILGQDPYHGVKQANGLSFSVERGIKIPPSLENIYKELFSDIQLQRPTRDLYGTTLFWRNLLGADHENDRTLRHKKLWTQQFKGNSAYHRGRKTRLCRPQLLFGGSGFC